MALDTAAGRAVAVGSGMAGLFSTRVLSDSFDEVVLIDRDNIPEAPSTRAGVPQGRHFHALLPGGLSIACDLFPGFADDLEAAGAVKCVAGQDFCAFRPEGKSYALAGIRSLDPSRFKQVSGPLRDSTEEVVTERGCIIYHESFGVVLRRITAGDYAPYSRR